MNLVIDHGNTRGKAAFFAGATLLKKTSFIGTEELTSWIDGYEIEHVLVSSVKVASEELLNAIAHKGRSFHLHAQLPLPIQLEYLTPQTLGVDRIAASVGAWLLYPNENVLVIDAGTCVNYELVDKEGRYQGGAISPGLKMRFESVHHFTARLPLLEPLTEPPLIGRNTEECIQSGIVNGMAEEIKGTITRYQSKYPNLRVILCGGDAAFFENYLKPTIFVAPDLVLMGLNGILQHNVKF
jgi:type III pantothenate kinase